MLNKINEHLTVTAGPDQNLKLKKMCITINYDWYNYKLQIFSQFKLVCKKARNFILFIF